MWGKGCTREQLRQAFSMQALLRCMSSRAGSTSRDDTLLKLGLVSCTQQQLRKEPVPLYGKCFVRKQQQLVVRAPSRRPSAASSLSGIQVTQPSFSRATADPPSQKLQGDLHLLPQQQQQPHTTSSQTPSPLPTATMMPLFRRITTAQRLPEQLPQQSVSPPA